MSSAVDFDKAFDSFIDSSDYDEGASALFILMRRAFQAGWVAAGAQAPPERKPIPFTETIIPFPMRLEG